MRRPLWGPARILQTPRSWLYFGDRSAPYREATLRAVEQLRLRPERRLGFLVRPGTYEYPFWALVRRAETITWCHLGVQNASRHLRDREPCTPDVVLSDRIDVYVAQENSQSLPLSRSRDDADVDVH